VVVGPAPNTNNGENQMTTLTKIDISALRKADSLCVHLSRDYTIARAIKRNPKTETNPFASDVEHIVNANIRLATMRGEAELAAGQVKCFSMSNLYPSQRHPATLILRTLREGDEITFRFAADAHSNCYIAAAGLHADTLYLDVLRKGKTIAYWELETSVCPDNSVRMCKGVPSSERYETSAVEARKAA